MEVPWTAGRRSQAPQQPESLAVGRNQAVKWGGSLQALSLQHPNTESRLMLQVDWLGEASP